MGKTKEVLPQVIRSAKRRPGMPEEGLGGHETLA